MEIARQSTAEKLIAYLNHRLSQEALVDWAEDAMQEGEFVAENVDELSEIVARLGVADVKAFGLTWDEVKDYLGQLGYAVKVEVTPQP